MEEISKQNYIVDSSFVLAVLLPDETHLKVEEYFIKHTQGTIQLFSTTLMPYEVANALYVATIRKRITIQIAKVLLKELLNLDISYEQVNIENVLNLCQNYNLSAYDASYLSLSKQKEFLLLSLDKKLLNLSNNT